MMRLPTSLKGIVSLVAVTGVLGIAYFAAANWSASSDVLLTATKIAPTVSATAPKPENASKPTDALVRVDATTVSADAFTLTVPAGWILASADGTRRSDGIALYGWLSNAQSEGISDPNVVTIAITDQLKDGKSFNEMVQANAWNADDVAQIVAFMKEEASATFPDYSADDVKVTLDDDQIGTSVAARNMLECLKPCYIEGGAQTNVRYFVDAPDRVYTLEVSTNTSPSAADFLNAADQVIRTFRLK